jgi:hypothetical protein
MLQRLKFQGRTNPQLLPWINILHFPTFQNALDKKYNITSQLSNTTKQPTRRRSLLITYKPILLIFGYITTAIALIAGCRIKQNGFDWMHGMNIFMAGFLSQFFIF